MLKYVFIPLLVCSALAAQTLAEVRKLADAGSLAEAQKLVLEFQPKRGQ
jgi:hypothetical protein